MCDQRSGGAIGFDRHRTDPAIASAVTNQERTDVWLLLNKWDRTIEPEVTYRASLSPLLVVNTEWRIMHDEGRIGMIRTANPFSLWA